MTDDLIQRDNALLPCPFCGSGIAKTVGNAGFSGVELMGAGTDRPYVWCGTCGSAGSFEDADAKAIAAWNTRADLHDTTKAQLAKAVEALREITESSATYQERAKARAVLAEIEKGGM